MKILIFLLASFAFSTSAFSQKLVKTYWDYYNTKIQSEYYTDAYGKMVGTFKGYSQYGGILMQGSYKDGAPIGKWTENYDSAFLGNVELDNGKILNISLIVLKEYNQQIPLSFHYIRNKKLN